MSRIEEFLELQDKHRAAVEKIEQIQKNLEEKMDKISDLTDQINEARTIAQKSEGEVKHLNARIKFLEEDKKRLETDKERLNKENEKFTQQMTKFSEMIENLNVSLTTKENLLLEKDKRLEERDTKIEQQMHLFQQIQEEKAKFIEDYLQKSIALTDKVSNLEKTLAEDQVKLKDLREKKKVASDDLFSKAMEMDQLNARLKEMEAEIEKHKSQKSQPAPAPVQAVPVVNACEGMSIIQSRGEVIKYLVDKIKISTRSLRIVVPKVSDLDEIQFFSLIEGLPATCVVNLACDLDATRDFEPLKHLRMKNVKMTSYIGNVFAISSNNDDIMLVVIDEGKYIGLYSNNKTLVSMMNQAIMQPFVNGTKIF